jgi:hypothetical protein
MLVPHAMRVNPTHSQTAPPLPIFFLFFSALQHLGRVLTSSLDPSTLNSS